jgi:hypothetical protein
MVTTHINTIFSILFSTKWMTLSVLNLRAKKFCFEQVLHSATAVCGKVVECTPAVVFGVHCNMRWGGQQSAIKRLCGGSIVSLSTARDSILFLTLSAAAGEENKTVCICHCRC